jgi:hypothetical protein
MFVDSLSEVLLVVFVVECGVLNIIWRCSLISLKHVCFMVFSFWSSPYFTTNETHVIDLEKESNITPMYLSPILLKSCPLIYYGCFPFRKVSFGGSRAGKGIEKERKEKGVGCRCDIYVKPLKSQHNIKHLFGCIFVGPCITWA